ncbi:MULTISPECIES: hypothetical protein [unclassified Bradyrhizobium]|uniref:hypothetical protein n=1 Tax=unclassified Bradyrhizobium TaxID=2631580 RepID=UPI002917140A|nr:MULTISPECIES: hypothetical protein [unclassified Bradyrhizobium]
MSLDEALVRELREAAKAGATASQLVLMVGRHLNAVDANFRLYAIAYMREAFFLSLREASPVGALAIFPDGHSSAAQIDDEMRPILDATRPKWVSQESQRRGWTTE